MILTRVLVIVLLFLGGTVACGDWVETNNDGGDGMLDFDGEWFASYDGSTPNPVTSWYKAGVLAGSLGGTLGSGFTGVGLGSDPGWTDNVIAITDLDTKRFAAENKHELFSGVRVTGSTCTVNPSTLALDLDEEFGVMARANDFEDVGFTSIDDLDAYAATFSLNNATSAGDQMKFSLYKIVDGAAVAVLTEEAHPLAPASLDDFIVSIELTAIGGQVTARLFDDRGDTTALAELNMTDPSPLPAGYSGVVCWDVASTDGIGVLYDTLESVTVPEPNALVLLVTGIAFLLGRKRIAR
ncbi:MAG: PEP-CTERM sorting domain-containing protein [Pirellulales bacterium]|nr:PEP-CTERM sorting domain-containing protein [Pirellulales bacterium]